MPLDDFDLKHTTLQRGTALLAGISMGHVVRFPRRCWKSDLIRTALLVIALAAFCLADLADVPILLIPAGLGLVALMWV